MIRGACGCGVEGYMGCGAVQVTRGCGSQPYDDTEEDTELRGRLISETITEGLLMLSSGDWTKARVEGRDEVLTGKS